MSPLIRDLFPGLWTAIMAENGISPVNNPSHLIGTDTGFAQVLQHTDWYAHRGDTRPPYRYRRYTEILSYVSASDRVETHVDIGCGAGLFSWAFLDWARRQSLSNDRVELYGIDHCPEMIRLAKTMRERLAIHIPDYPVLKYYSEVDALLQDLTNSRAVEKNYTITLGHVLVQANTPANIENFSRIIAYIVSLMNPGSNCALWAVDARGRSGEFESGWRCLLNGLSLTDVYYREHNVPATRINDSHRAKVAFLNRTS